LPTEAGPDVGLVAELVGGLCRRIGYRGDRADLVQAVMVSLIERPVPAVVDAGHARALLRRRVRWAVIDELRTLDHAISRAIPSCEADALLQGAPFDGEGPDEAAERRESVAQLHLAIAELPARLRGVVLGQLGDEPVRAAAARLGVTPTRVSQLRADALIRLREVMASHCLRRRCLRPPPMLLECPCEGLPTSC
jgi:RNA polymerase sigma factor (sigma-70 family)